MARSVRFAAVSLVGPWALFAAMALEVPLMFQRNAEYLGEAMFTLRWMAVDFLYFGPIVAAVAATDAARLMRPGRADLTLAHHRRRLWWALGWCVLPVAAWHAALFFGAVALGGDYLPRGGWGRILVALVAQLLAIAWFGCLGSFIGRYLPPLVAGLAGAATGLLLMLCINSSSAGVDPFEPIIDFGASVSQIGILFGLQPLFIRIALLTVTGVLLAWAPLRWNGRYPLPAPLGLVAGLVTVVAVAVVYTQAPGDKDFVGYQVQPDRCVDAAGVEFCYFHEHERAARKFIPVLTGIVDKVNAAGYGSILPTRLEESGRRARESSGPGVVSLGTIDVNLWQSSADEEDLAASMFAARWCSQLFEDEYLSDGYMEDSMDLSFSMNAILAGEPEVYYFGDEAPVTYPLPLEDLEAIWQRWLVCNLG